MLLGGRCPAWEKSSLREIFPESYIPLLLSELHLKNGRVAEVVLVQFEFKMV